MVVLDANTSKELLEKIAAHCNTPIAFDAVSISKVERCRNILDRLFIFKPNLYEAEALCKSLVPPDQDEDRVIRAFDSPDILYKASEYAGYLINKGVKNVMISLGEDGVYYANASTIGVIPTMVTDIVNTSGCGDTFLSGAIRGFLDNADIETMARYGSAAAAICASCEETVSEKLSYRKITEMLGR